MRDPKEKEARFVNFMHDRVYHLISIIINDVHNDVQDLFSI